MYTILGSMTTHIETPGNKRKVAQLEQAMAIVLAEVLRRGFYGNASLELSVQDGTIQSIRRRVEQLEK